jgi:hypothetical protein
MIADRREQIRPLPLIRGTLASARKGVLHECMDEQSVKK